jgi:hypothetical protein
MNELDDIWSQMLAEATQNAKASGRHDVADYLSLKASNDLIRQRGVQWLFDSLIEIAGEANRRNASISLEREDPHNFKYYGANLVGSLLRLRLGVRSLTLEAGWTRTPADGFIKGGAMAIARISHFGMKRSGAELSLRFQKDMPCWVAGEIGENPKEFHSLDLLRHFAVFIGDIG